MLVRCFGPPLDVGLDAGLLERRPKRLDRLLDERLAALAASVEEPGELAIAVRLEGLEGEVLELPFHLPDPEPLGERGVDLHRLAGDPGLLVDRQGRQRAHVVEPVGELDQDDPDVLGHRQEHLANVLGLLLLVGVGAELRQLRDPVDELGDLGPEAILDVGQAELGVLGHVVEEGRLDGDRVDPQVGDGLGAGDRVDDVRLARGAMLAGVGLDGQVECRIDPRQVGLGVVALDGCEQRRTERLDRVDPARALAPGAAS